MSKFSILSIDGGGIRGILPAQWLIRLERELTAKNRGRLLNVFDLFAGASTGSIIAAGLAIGKEISTISSMYDKQAKTIFPKSVMCNPLRFWGGSLRPIYNGVGLGEVLGNVFEDKKLGEVQKRLIVIAFNAGTRTLKLFDSESELDKGYLLRDIVHASCAAPVYFPSKIMNVDGISRPLIDGGVTANNPAALALAKAMQQGHHRENVVLVSLGTGVSARPITELEGTTRGWVHWAKPIVEVMFDGSSSANEIIIDHLLGSHNYFRFQKRDLRTDPALDGSSNDHLKALRNEADNYVDHELVRFRKLVEVLSRSDRAPSMGLAGTWRSKYSWFEGGKIQQSRSETLELSVTGDEVSGKTIKSKFPYSLSGTIDGSYLIGQTTSVEKPFKLKSYFVLRINLNDEKEMRGRWIGTGDDVYYGEWTLSKT